MIVSYSKDDILVRKTWSILEARRPLKYSLIFSGKAKEVFLTIGWGASEQDIFYENEEALLIWRGLKSELDLSESQQAWVEDVASRVEKLRLEAVI